MEKIIKMMVVAFAVSCVALAGDAPAQKGAEKAEAKRKARIEFMKGQRDKRWEFEDESLRMERQFQDEMMKAHRDLERARDDQMGEAKDAKAAAAARDEFTKKDKELGEKREEFRKKMEERRRTFRESMEKAHKEFEESQKK